MRVTVVGAGLAGCEAALQLAKEGVEVTLYEMRPAVMPAAHHGSGFAELVCSNSFKSDDPKTAAGLLKRELSILGCELIELAQKTRVPAGGALAVDRELFSQAVENKVAQSPNISVVREEYVLDSTDEIVLIAAGPLASRQLVNSLAQYSGPEALSFYDAAAPIVLRESLDMDRVFEASRYGKGEGSDYLNIALDEDEYRVFYDALVSGKRTIDKEFERKELFAACQPVEEVARTGYDALRYGALKPVGIDDPRTGRWPYAIVQLRKEDAFGQSFNLVGFQTNLTWGEQKRIFSLLPGMQNAEFVRFGVMHRNTFFDAPKTLNDDMSLKLAPNIFLAGQISGTEGYTEAIASGLLAANNILARLKGEPPFVLPVTTVLGCLMNYALTDDGKDYQPMHVNYGLIPPLDTRVKNKQERYAQYAQRAIADLETYIEARNLGQSSVKTAAPESSGAL